MNRRKMMHDRFRIKSKSVNVKIMRHDIGTREAREKSLREISWQYRIKFTCDFQCGVTPNRVSSV